MVPGLARGPALRLAGSFPFLFENGSQPGWRYPAFITRSGNPRRISRYILVPALRKDKASVHQGSPVLAIPHGTTTKISQNPLLRTTQPTPLIQLPHDINHAPNFELESPTIVEFPNPKGIDITPDIGLSTSFFHLDV